MRNGTLKISLAVARRVTAYLRSSLPGFARLCGRPPRRVFIRNEQGLEPREKCDWKSVGVLAVGTCGCVSALLCAGHGACDHDWRDRLKNHRPTVSTNLDRNSVWLGGLRLAVRKGGELDGRPGGCALLPQQDTASRFVGGIPEQPIEVNFSDRQCFLPMLNDVEKALPIFGPDGRQFAQRVVFVRPGIYRFLV